MHSHEDTRTHPHTHSLSHDTNINARKYIQRKRGSKKETDNQSQLRDYTCSMQDKIKRHEDICVWSCDFACLTI